MTNTSRLMQLLSEQSDGVDPEIIKSVYRIFRERESAVFCSYMAGYDHPEERQQANEKFVKEMLALKVENPSKTEAIELIYSLLNDEGICHLFFRNKVFHNPNDEWEDSDGQED